MSRIQINGRGHEVTVEHDGAELDYVIQKAQKLWNDTRPEPKDVGFSATAASLALTNGSVRA